MSKRKLKKGIRHRDRLKNDIEKNNVTNCRMKDEVKEQEQLGKAFADNIKYKIDTLRKQAVCCYG